MDIAINLNGEPRQLPAKTTLEGLINQLGLKGKRIAIEMNQEIILRSEYATTTLQSGDKIEIVHAIGGG